MNRVRAGCRISRVRLKAGGDVILPFVPEPEQQRSAALERLRGVLDMHYPNDIAGFAMLIWSRDLIVTTDSCVYAESPLLKALLPDFAAAQFRAHHAAKWGARIAMYQMGHGEE